MNFEKVVHDITNPGPAAIKGGRLTQVELKRVDRAHIAHVRAMARSVCYCLLGKEMAVPQRADEVMVWAQAAGFLAGRIQGSQAQMPGREPDMSAHAAKAMSTVLGKIEAALKLMSNRQKVVQDITNSGPKGLNG